MLISYTVNYKNKQYIFGNYPDAAWFVKLYSFAEDDVLEIKEWRENYDN